MKPRSKFLALAAAFVIGLVGYATVHKNLPYFADVPAARFRAWHPAPYLPAGEGPSWKLSQYLEDGGALNADVDHFVLQRDGKAYDLINSRDTWGFADAISWKIVLKTVLSLMGKCSDQMRLPMVPPTAATRARLERLAGELGLLKRAPISEGVRSEVF